LGGVIAKNRMRRKRRINSPKFGGRNRLAKGLACAKKDGQSQAKRGSKLRYKNESGMNRKGGEPRPWG